MEMLWNDPLYRLVVLVCFWQVVGLGGLLGVIWLLRILRHRRTRVSARTVENISEKLFGFLAGTLTVDELVAGTERYSVQQRAAVLERYVATLSGQSEVELSRYFARSGMLRSATRMCRSIFWWNRLEGARILAAGGYHAGADVLLDLLDDRNLAVRLAAARGLGHSQNPEYIGPLLRALRRGRLSKAQIAEVLVTFGPASRERLRELVMQLPSDTRASQLRATTVEVLALVGDAGATPFIQYALAAGEADGEVRVAVFKAASILRAALSTDEMRSGLADPVWQVRAHAATAVGKAQMQSLVPDLGVLLGDRSWWVRTKAARALYELGDPGIAMLESVARTHEDSYARAMALRVLTEDPAYSELMELSERIGDGVVSASSSGPAKAPAGVSEAAEGAA